MALLVSVPYEEELKKNPELKESDIQLLRSWCAKQPHLPKISDSALALFLYSNYYRIEPTKTTIDTFYTFRTHWTEFFANRDPIGSKELRKTFNVASVLTLDQPTREGYKVIYGRMIDYDPSKYVYNDIIKMINITIDLLLYREGTTDGHIIVIDMFNITLAHVARISPMGLQKFIRYLQEALPVRLKGLHFMNASPLMDIVLNMMRPVLKKELMSMLYLHSTANTLDQFIPREILPNEVGGKAGPLLELHWAQVKRLEEYRDWFLEDERSARVDETKRIGKTKTAADLFGGVEGSFKKLEID